MKIIKFIFVLLILMFIVGCNSFNDKQIDVLRPDFNLTVGKLIKSGFYSIPEDVPILGKQIGDTLLYYQFDDNLDRKSKPQYMFCKFPISNINTDSIENFFERRMCFNMCEYKNNNLLETFYIKHQQKGYVFQCIVDKKNYTLTLCYTYPQID